MALVLRILLKALPPDGSVRKKITTLFILFMKKTNLLFWEDSVSPVSQEGLSRSLHALSVRLLPASTAESCLKWLQGPVQVDLLVFTLGGDPETRMKEYQQLKKRP